MNSDRFTFWILPGFARSISSNFDLCIVSTALEIMLQRCSRALACQEKLQDEQLALKIERLRKT